MAKPVKNFRWAENDVVDPVSGVNNVIEPPEIKKTNGWNRKEKPARNWWNWCFRVIQQWLDYFEDWTDEVFGLPHTFTDTTQSTDKDTGAIILEGGMGIEKNLNVGGTIKNIDTTQSTDKDTGAIILEGGMGIEKNLNVGGTIKNIDTTDSSSTTTGSIVTAGGMAVTKNLTIGGGRSVIYRDSSGIESIHYIATKVIEIGDWNMDSNDTIQIDCGIVNADKIRNIFALVRTDSGSSYYYPLNYFYNSADPSLIAGGVGGFYNFVVTGHLLLSLYRRTGGFFDSSYFDSTSYNRGWVYVEYEV